MDKWYTFFRILEKLSLLAGAAGLVMSLWIVLRSGDLDVLLFSAAFGTFVVGVCLTVFSSNRIDQKFELFTAQSDFAINAQFLALFERSPVPYVILNQKGGVININQAAVTMLQLQPESISEKNFLDRFVESDKSDVSILANKVTAGVTINDVELSLRSDSSEPVWVLFSAYTNPHNKEIFISMVNVTQAKKVDVAKSEFLALATHQLRTPIAAIRWNTELLQKRIPDTISDTTDKYVEKIARNTNRMSALINDFLNVSKLELGTFAAEVIVINLHEFFDAVIDEFSEQLQQKNITLHRTEPPVEFSFKADTRLFHVVVSNLLSNAVKYVRSSGSIWLSAEVIEGKLTLEIKDDGIGIPGSEIENLFTKFYRATNATQHQTEGTGLGLYVVQQAVEKMGGTITVTSDTDAGAAFTVVLPLVK